MSENLLSRVRRLISGTVYDGIEAVEAAMPETTMREAIREIDRTIDELRDEVSKVQAERHIAGKRIKFSEEKIAALASKIETALSGDREDLAQAAIERQMDLEVQIPVLEKTQAEASDRIAELGGYVSAMSGRKAEMEEELQSFQDARDYASGDAFGAEDLDENRGYEKRADKAEQAFDRAMKNSTGVDGVGRSDRETTSKLIELEAMERKSKISARLAAHKATMESKAAKAG